VSEHYVFLLHRADFANALDRVDWLRSKDDFRDGRGTWISPPPPGEPVTVSLDGPPAPEADVEVPLTIAVGRPIDDESDFGSVNVDREELELLASDIAAIEDQLVALATRFEALSHPRLRALPRLTVVGGGPGGGGSAA
jgi:hypothetical protein